MIQILSLVGERDHEEYVAWAQLSFCYIPRSSPSHISLKLCAKCTICEMVLRFQRRSASIASIAPVHWRPEPNNVRGTIMNVTEMHNVFRGGGIAYRACQSITDGLGLLSKPTLGALLLAGSALPVSTAYAQVVDSGSPARATPTRVGNEIIVTARRREEVLANVPAAIAAFSGQDIVEQGIRNENDLQSAVPGLVIRQNGGVNSFNFAIRGQSVDGFTNSPPSVLPYVNEVQIVNHSASTFYDMGGIQVLKGPQGTLFGRNATGGAVLLSTAKATDELGGYIQARYGSYDSRNVQGAINLPIGDVAAIRFAGSYTGGGAFVKDYFTNEEYGDLDQKSGRITVALTPEGRFSNTTVFQYTEEDGTNTPYLLWSTNQCGSSAVGLVDTQSCALNAESNPTFAAFLAANPKLYQGGLDDAIALQRELGPWKSLGDYPPFHKAKSRYVINTTTFEVSSNLTIKNIFGYNKSTAHDGYDYDGSPYPYFQFAGERAANGIKMVPIAGTLDQPGLLLETTQISNELQIQGRALDDRLEFVAGVYWLKQEADIESDLDFGNFLPIAPPARFAYAAQIDVRSLAGFGQASYKLTDSLSLTGGFRYTRDKTSIKQLPGSVFLPFVPGNPPERTKASKPSWTVSIDYRASPELLIYAVTRGSWRSGGYNYSTFPNNVTAAEGGNRFLPETTRDIEVGLKYSGTGFGIPIAFNADLFNQWVSNIQRASYFVSAGGLTLLTANVPKARIRGAEADLSLRPSEWVQFGGSINYTDAKYTSNRVNVLGDDIFYGPFADVPKVSGTLFAELSAPLGNIGELRLRGDLYAQSKMYFSNIGATLNPNTTLPSYSLVNVRLTWSNIMGTDIQIAAFARNLFNEKYYSGGNPGAAGGAANVVNPGIRRMLGVEARFDF